MMRCGPLSMLLLVALACTADNTSPSDTDKSDPKGPSEIGFSGVVEGSYIAGRQDQLCVLWVRVPTDNDRFQAGLYGLAESRRSCRNAGRYRNDEGAWVHLPEGSFDTLKDEDEKAELDLFEGEQTFLRIREGAQVEELIPNTAKNFGLIAGVFDTFIPDPSRRSRLNEYCITYLHVPTSDGDYKEYGVIETPRDCEMAKRFKNASGAWVYLHGLDDTEALVTDPDRLRVLNKHREADYFYLHSRFIPLSRGKTMELVGWVNEFVVDDDVCLLFIETDPNPWFSATYYGLVEPTDNVNGCHGALWLDEEGAKVRVNARDVAPVSFNWEQTAQRKYGDNVTFLRLGGEVQRLTETPNKDMHGLIDGVHIDVDPDSDFPLCIVYILVEEAGFYEPGTWGLVEDPDACADGTADAYRFQDRPGAAVSALDADISGFDDDNYITSLWDIRAAEYRYLNGTISEKP